MKKFRVKVCYDVTMSTIVTVEAEDEKQAQEIAEEVAGDSEDLVYEEEFGREHLETRVAYNSFDGLYVLEIEEVVEA